jgi:hypothetical protein
MTHLQVVATGEPRLAQAVHEEDHPGIGVLDLEDVVLLDRAHPEIKQVGKTDRAVAERKAGTRLKIPSTRTRAVNVSGLFGRGPARSPAGSTVTVRGPV